MKSLIVNTATLLRILSFCVFIALIVPNLAAQSSGTAWRQVLPDSLPTQIIRITANDSAVFAIGRHAVYRVTNNRLVPFVLPHQQYPIMYATSSFHFAVIDSILWRSRNGRDWKPVGLLPTSVWFLNIVDMENGKLHYAATTKGVYRSKDSGRTWQPAWLQGMQIRDIGIVADTIYAGGFCGAMQRSVDGGKTWEEERFPYLGSEVYCVRKVESFLSGIYVLLFSEPPSGTLYRYNGAKDISSRKEEIGYINRYWGLNTTMTTRKGEILRVVVNLDERRQAILRSTNGQNWDSLTTNGLPNTSYFDGIAANSQSLFITTNNGLSLYTLDAPATTVAVRESEPLPATWRISPNPADNNISIHVELLTPAHIRCTLHNVLGQEVACVADRFLSAGEQELNWNASALPQGLYICHYTTNRQVQGSRSILISR